MTNDIKYGVRKPRATRDGLEGKFEKTSAIRF